MDEEQYLDELNQTRAKEPRVDLPEKPIVRFPWGGFVIAILNDSLDYIAFIGSIPIVGDFLDLITSLIRWMGRAMGQSKTGNLNLVGATIIEFIPGGDLVPSYTIEVLKTYYEDKRATEEEYQNSLTAAQTAHK